MMPHIIEGRLRFDFPDDWNASKFDDWSFYRNQFARFGDAEIKCKKCKKAIRCPDCKSKRGAGNKGIDILALSSESTSWHIEVKDYTTTLESSFEFLADVVALKVRDSLACLVAARLNAPESIEQRRSIRALRTNRIRIVLHLESRVPHNRLINPVVQRANVLLRLKQLVKAVDPHPLVVCMADMHNLPWSVTQI